MTYRDQVLADGATHYWPMQEAGGTITADLLSTGGQGGEITSGLGYQGVTATDGAMLVNNTNNQSALALLNQAYLVAPFTLEVWVWLWALTATYQESLMYGNSSNSIELLVGSDGKPDLHQRGGSGTHVSPDAISILTWHHLVATFGSGIGSLYVDGVVKVASAMTISIPGTGPFGLGGFTDRTQPLNGFVASPALYHTILPETAIIDHYNGAELRGVAPYYLGPASVRQVGLVGDQVAAVQTHLTAQDDYATLQAAKLDAILAAVRRTY